jgi:hypothetical protein
VLFKTCLACQEYSSDTIANFASHYISSPVLIEFCNDSINSA